MKLLIPAACILALAISCGADTTNETTELFLASLALPGETYYIDASGGSDSNDCLSPSTACRTLDFVSNANYRAGSTILFKRGETFRGQLIPKNGTLFHDICYGAAVPAPGPYSWGP